MSSRTQLRRARGRGALLAGLAAGAALVLLALPSLAAPVPSVATTIDASPEVLIGENFTFTVNFANSGDATGYGPYVDLVLPRIGADGAGAVADDGISFVSATYLGQAVQATTLTFDAGGNATHPYARTNTGAPVVVTGTAGDQLVVLRLPFGSYVPSQPQLPVVVTASTSSLADANVALALRATGGFMFGTDATDNPTSDPSLIGVQTTTNVTPTLFKLQKTYAGPEHETATGPNWPRQYTVSVDVAAGQTVTNLDVTDILPTSLQFVAVDSSTPASSAIATPSTTTPGGTLTRRFASIVGGSGANDASMTFSFYVPRVNAAAGTVLNPVTGAAATTVNDASTTGSWTPTDARDAAGAVSSDTTPNDHTLTVRSLAIQKSVSDLTHPGAPQPGDTLEYTLSTQISDFFAFDTVTVTDVISDGQLVDGSFTPTLTYLRDGASSTASVAPGNYAVVANGDGTSTITFDVSDELLDRSFAGGRVLGGCIPDAGTATPDCSVTDLGATQVTIAFRTTIQSTFTSPPPGKNASVDGGDTLADTVTASGRVLDAETFAPTASIVNDSSSLELTIVTGTLTKSVYAVNGVVCPCGSPIQLKPGDTITYGLAYAIPISAIEDFEVIDYLPLPVFSASEVTTFSATASATAPPAGTARYGPSDTFHDLPSAPAPTMTTNAAGNSVTWDYPGYDNHPVDAASTVHILFTVTASDEPFADGLFLTNQGQVESSTTNGADSQANSIVQVVLNEPSIPRIVKGAVATDGATAAFSPPTVGPVSFTAPGSAGNRWSGTVTSTNLAASPINSNLTGLQRGDLVTFALVVENTGTSPAGAFDVKVKDDLPAGFVIPAGGLNVRAADGAGTALAFTDLGGGLLGTGIQLDDGATGSIKTYSASNGQNIAIVTYDLEVASTVVGNQLITNTATLFAYASTEGGPTFTTGVTDTATATTGVFVPTKSLVSTSEAFTTGSGVAVGEVVRYRLKLQVPETGTLANTQVRDNLPPGLTFLDGTAEVMFVSDGAGMSSSGTNALSGAGLDQNGNETTVNGLSPIFALPDANVSTSTSTDSDTYSSGTDVFYKLGDFANNDGDANAEFVVVEFNAVVDNSTNGANPRNVLGSTLANTFFGQVNGTQVGATSANSTVTVQTPQVTLAKTTTTPSISATDTVAYRLVLANSNNTNATTAYELTINDPLPAGLTLDLGSITTSTSGTVGTVTDTSAGNTVSFTIDSLAKNSSLTIDFTASSAATLTPGQVLGNTGTYTATSLQGTNGTTGNVTGSDTPGAPGTTTGERTGTGVNPNNLRGTGLVNVTVYSSSLSGTIYTDVNNNGVYNAGTDTPLSGKTVTLEGTDHLGTPVSLSTTTNGSGAYTFSSLRSGTYTITKAAAAGAFEGSATVGSQASGTAAAPAITGISIPANANVTGTGNNIGEILRADLSITKTVAEPLSVLGQNVIYTIAAANAGPSPATNTVITDTLPANMSFVSAVPSQGSCSGTSVVTCSLGTVAVGATPSVTLTVTPTAAGSFANTATIGSAVVDQDGSNNSATANSTVESMSPAKSVAATSEPSSSGSAVAIGEIVRYRLQIAVPEVPLPGLQLHDQLPPGLTFIDDGTAMVALVSNGAGLSSSTLAGPGLAVTGNGATVGSITPTFVLPDSAVSSSTGADTDTYSTGTDVYVKLGDLANADADADVELAVVELNAIVDNTISSGTAQNVAGSALANVFQPRVGGAALGPASNTVTSTVTVPSLSVSLTSDRPKADAGDTVTYEIVVSNAAGANVATSLETSVNVPVPAGMTLNTGSVSVVFAGGGAGVADTSSASVLDLILASLPPGATATITYTATLATSVAPGAVLTHNVAVTGSTLTGDGSAANATGSTAGPPNTATGERTGTGSQSPNTLAAVDSVGVTLHSSSLAGTVYVDLDSSGTYNAGDTPVAGKTVTLTGTDHLGNAVSTPVATDGAGAYAFTGLRPGTYSITKSAAVDRAEGAVTVGSQASGTAGNATIAAITLPAGADTTGTGNLFAELVRADLHLTKTGTPATVVVGDDVTFTLTVQNDGPSTATNVVLTDPLPAALQYVSVLTDTGSCGEASNTVTCPLGTMNVGAVATVTIVARSTAEGTFTNTATVAASEVDQEPGDNVDDESTYVQLFAPAKGIVATSQSSTSGSDVTVGEIVRYRLQVTLSQSPGMTDFILRDVLPAGMRFLDDGTAMITLVSNGAGVVSSTLSGAGLAQSGNETNVASLTPTFVLPDAAVSASQVLDDDTYGSGGDVWLKLGDLSDNDGDADNEYAVVELNALVTNVAGNQAGTSLANSFDVRMGSNPNIPTSNTVTATVVAPAVAATKTALAPKADATGTVPFRIVVTATAGANRTDAFDLELSDTLPSGMSLNVGSITVGTTGTVVGAASSSSGNTVQVSATRIAPGATITVDYTATLDAGATPGQTLVNGASVSATTLPGDGTTANATGSVPGTAGGTTGERTGSGGVNDLAAADSDAVTVYSSSIAGHIFTDLDDSGTLDPGEPAVAGRGVTLTGTDHLGNAVTRTTTTDAGGDYVFNGLRPGTYTVTKAAAVGAADGPAFAGSRGGTAGIGVVTGASLPLGSDTVATAYDFSELIRADLAVAKSADQAQIIIGQQASFTLTVTNHGPSPATSVTLDDTLPANFTYDSALPAQGACTWSGGHVLCSLGALAAGASTTVKVVGTPTGLGLTTNSADVTGAEVDPALANNDSSASVHVAPVPIVADLQVTKTVDQPSVAVGKPARFTVTVTNNGPDSVSGVQLRDELPVGPVAAAPITSQGTCSFADTSTVLCALGTLAPGASVVVTQTLTPTSVGSIVNTATVNGALDRETDPNNNRATATVEARRIDGCTLRPKKGASEIVGTSGNDVICGGPQDEMIRGGGGNDVIYGGGGDDVLLGGPGTDKLFGGAGNDRVDGGAGADMLCGNAGRDTIVGGRGADGLSGGSGPDRINGGPGNDGLYGDGGADRIDGGSGHDRLIGGGGRDLLLARDRTSDLADGGLDRDRGSFDLSRDFFRSVERLEFRR